MQRDSLPEVPVRAFACGAIALVLATISPGASAPAAITAAGRPAELIVRPAGPHSVRITLKPLGVTVDDAENPALATRPPAPPALRLTVLAGHRAVSVGTLRVDVLPNPLTVIIKNRAGGTIQELSFEPDGRVTFETGHAPVLGLGEGGPRPARGDDWRRTPVQFDRRGAFDTMEPRWQADMYGSRNPAPVLFGTAGWGLFVAAPWVTVDLRHAARGVFQPVAPDASAAPQTEGNQQQALGKGLPPASSFVPGLFDVFVFDASDPAAALRDFAAVTGPAAMPPRWALGYMQSHRTLEDDRQMLAIVDTFRQKRLPLDAVIYLGTGFAPRGWNTTQPSFTFNPDVFTRDARTVIADIHARHAKVVVHVVPWDRDTLPTLDASTMTDYWQQHVGLVDAGVDAFWPDEGDWFNLHERVKRHQLYYRGPLSTRPNVRPWHLQRNGYPGIAQWGGWVWSGDTDSSWKTLEAQVAVGLNYSLSIGPFWGSDIGGFYPNSELTGELYARWFQFAAFCGSFRSHGRVWWTRLPWGWGLDDVGPREYGNRNAPIPADDPRNILPSELKNPAIEPIARRYAELRYQLLPYTYTLAREARDTGLPLMRAMWLHYPHDATARGMGTQYLWGRDLLIAPVFTKAAVSRSVYLPRGTWYDWWTGAREEGGRSVERAVDLATMPIYVRAGAIVPVDPVRQYADEPVAEPTTIRVYTGADGTFTLYDDDGISQEYLTGKGAWTRFAWSDASRRLTVESAAPAGTIGTAVPRTFIVRLEPEGVPRTVRFDGTSLRVTF